MPPAVSGSFTPPPWRWIPDERDRDRTRLGLIVLAVAVLSGLIPFVGPFAYLILGLVGAIVAITTRKSFGAYHRSNVKASVASWILGFVVVVVGVAVAILILISAAATGPAAMVGAIPVAVDTILGIGVVSTFLFGLAWVLLPYTLSSLDGRVFLWGAFGIDLGASFALAFFYRDALIVAMILFATTSNTDAFTAAFTRLPFFSVASAVLYAIAYVLAARRVQRGEVALSTAEASPGGSGQT